MKNKTQKTKQLTVGINASFLRKPGTGLGQVTLNFLRKLSEFKIQNSKSKEKEIKFILYLEEPLSKNVKLSKNFETRVFLPMWRRDDLIRKTWWEKYQLPKKAKEDGCDVFFSLYQCPTILPKGIKHIMLVHDIIPKLFREYLDTARKETYQMLTERAIKKADKIVVVSKRTEKDLIQHLKIEGKKITVNYIDTDEIYKKKATKENTQKMLRKYKLKPGYILAGGGLELRKNIEGVISAYNYLYEKNKNEHFVAELPKLVIYGKLMPHLAPLVTDAEKSIKKLNLTKCVKLLDAVPQDNLPALFANASMFVYPSRYEGFGLPVLEAMNQGTPVITSKTSSLPEVGRDAALYCHPEDPKDIAMVMKNVLVNKNLRETLSRRGKERAKAFSWKNFVDKFLKLLNA